jgi:hypothetical protein
MALADLDAIFDICQKHLSTTNSNDTEIDSFLTRYLLVYICGEYEKEIKEIIKRRVDKTDDKELASFVAEKVDVRSLRISDIKGNILKPFSEKCVKFFDSKIRGGDSEIKYQNIVENRNLVAHGETVNMTFKELNESYKLATDVVKAISDAINPQSS